MAVIPPALEDVCLKSLNNEKNPLLGNSRKRKSSGGDIGVDRLQCHAKACVENVTPPNHRQGCA